MDTITFVLLPDEDNDVHSQQFLQDVNDIVPIAQQFQCGEWNKAFVGYNCKDASGPYTLDGVQFDIDFKVKANGIHFFDKVQQMYGERRIGLVV